MRLQPWRIGLQKKHQASFKAAESSLCCQCPAPDQRLREGNTILPLCRKAKRIASPTAVHFNSPGLLMLEAFCSWRHNRVHSLPKQYEQGGLTGGRRGCAESSRDSQQRQQPQLHGGYRGGGLIVAEKGRKSESKCS